MKNRIVYYIISSALLLLAYSSFAHAQSDKKHQKFEKKLNEFRYSLYVDLENIEELNNVLESSGKSHPLLKKLEDFIDENEKEIFNYQQYNLLKYKDESIDFESFEKDTSFFGDSGEASRSDIDSYDQMIALYGKSLGRFLTLNPLNYAFMIKNIYLARTFSAVEMGTQSMKDAIANPKIKSTENGDHKWKIWFDHYSRLYEFEYDLDSNSMKMMGVYVRKK